MNRLIECQHEDCDNVAAWVDLKGAHWCHKHKPKEAEVADQELDRRHEEFLAYGYRAMKEGW